MCTRKTAIICSLFALVLALLPAMAAEPLEVKTYLHDYQMYSVGDTLQLPLTAKGGTPPYAWSLDGSTAPPGIRLGEVASQGSTVPALVGSLTEAGFWNVAVTVTDGTGSKAQTALNIGVSLLRLLDGFIPAPAGQFIRMIPRIAGGTPPYRIAIASGSFLPLGIQFDPVKNEFYGTAAIPHGFGVSLDIRDTAANILRVVLAFGPVSGVSTDLSVGALLEIGSCGELSAKVQTGELVSTTMEWGDGETETFPPISGDVSTHHRYSHDGTFSLWFTVVQEATGLTYRGGYEVKSQDTGHELCQLDLRLQPQALYLVRGRTSGRFRLDSRTLLGDVHPLDPGKFTWSSTKPSLIRVDESGNVSCSGIGEGKVELVAKEILWRKGARVFCGEYTVEPALSHLSPTDGNNQVQLSVFGITSDGQRAPALAAPARFSAGQPATGALISLDGGGLVKVLRPPSGKSENAYVNAAVDDVSTRNWSIVRATAANVNILANPWRGDNITIWFPDQVAEFNYRDILEQSDALRITDLVYGLEEEQAGLRPFGGGMLHLANEIGFENDPNTPCGVAGNPVGLGTSLDGSSCFVIAQQSPQASAPQWGVWAHELGHDFHSESRKFSDWLSVSGSEFLGFAASESVASHHSCYSIWFLLERSQEYRIPANNFSALQSVCAFDRTFEDLKRYQATGPDIKKIDVGGFFDIMMVLRVEYGWEAQRRFFSVFLPAYEGFPFPISTLDQQTSFFVAAYSAATRTDLRDRFRNDFGFPIDNAWYEANYAAIDRLVSQRDPAVTAGVNQATQPGVPISLRQATVFDPLDRPLIYQWKITSQPAGSAPTLSDPKALNPTFVAGTVGSYRLELVASNGLFTSRASAVNIKIGVSADINGDGKPDVVWRNRSTGQNQMWTMNGISRTNTTSLDPNADAQSKIVGVADFNADGMSDILWRNSTTGSNYVWFMNGTAYSGISWLESVADISWKIVGVGTSTPIASRMFSGATPRQAITTSGS